MDYDTVYNFGKKADIITIEIEKVNIEALEQLEKEGKLFAQSDASPGESWELKSKSTDAYSATIQNYPAELVFIRDGGKIKAIKLSVADGQVVLTGEKE